MVESVVALGRSATRNTPAYGKSAADRRDAKNAMKSRHTQKREHSSSHNRRRRRELTGMAAGRIGWDAADRDTTGRTGRDKDIVGPTGQDEDTGGRTVQKKGTTDRTGWTGQAHFGSDRIPVRAGRSQFGSIWKILGPRPSAHRIS